jgi:WD40 repeat protein
VIDAHELTALWLFQEDVDENPYHKLHLEGHEHAVRALAARGRTLVSGSYDSMVRVWDIITGTCKWVLVGHTQKGRYRHKRLHSHCSEKES